MNKIIISAIIVLISVFSVACEEPIQEVSNNHLLCGYGVVCGEETVAFDMEGQTSFVRNTEERKLAIFDFHIGDEVPDEMRPREVAILVKNGELVDWHRSVVMLDSMLLSPLVKGVHFVNDPEFNEGPDEFIVLIWNNEVPWSPGALIHHLVIDVKTKEPVPSGTKIEFWVEGMTFKRYNDDSGLQYLGEADGTLGDPTQSATFDEALCSDDFIGAPAGLVFLR